MTVEDIKEVKGIFFQNFRFFIIRIIYPVSIKENVKHVAMTITLMTSPSPV